MSDRINFLKTSAEPESDYKKKDSICSEHKLQEGKLQKSAEEIKSKF
jgi:hypothetical protein